MRIKTNLRSVVLGAVLLAGSVVAGASNNIVVMPYQNTPYTLVAAEAVDTQIQSLVIVDDRGEAVYVSRPADLKGSYGKLFDFSRLSDGVYKIRMRSERGEVSAVNFVIRNGSLANKKPQLQIDAENELKVWSNEDFVFVSQLNRTNTFSVVSVEDAYGRVLFNKELPKELTYSGRFNVGTLPRGEYKVNVVSGTKAFSYAFRK